MSGHVEHNTIPILDAYEQALRGISKRAEMGLTSPFTLGKKHYYFNFLGTFLLIYITLGKLDKHKKSAEHRHPQNVFF